MGNTVVNEGETKPIQRYFYVDVDEPQKYLAAFKKYQKYIPNNQQVLMGCFVGGVGWENRGIPFNSGE